MMGVSSEQARVIAWCVTWSFYLSHKMRNIPVMGYFISLGLDIKTHGAKPLLTHDEMAK